MVAGLVVLAVAVFLLVVLIVVFAKTLLLIALWSIPVLLVLWVVAWLLQRFLPDASPPEEPPFTQASTLTQATILDED